jgi:S1-C subfamily serine protease
MHLRISVALAASLLLAAQALPARADNPMGYRLLSQQEAASLQFRHGALGMDVERAQQINDSGLTFDIMRVKQVRPGSAGQRAGFAPGDSIIAVDGRVFPSIATFAAYVGSVLPGTTASVDYIPAGGGPAQAQRITVTIGAAGRPSPQPPPGPGEQGGLSTGAKIAIGAGAVALFGCYEMGCFSRHRSPATQLAPNTYQQR